MRIATFNLENLDDSDRAVVPFEERCRTLRPQLARIDADILCLQEIHGQKDDARAVRRLRVLDRLLTGTQYAAFQRVETHKRNGTGALDVHNLAILSRYPILASGQVWHDFVPEPSHRYLSPDPVAEPASDSASGPAEDAMAPLSFDRPVLWATADLGKGRHVHVVNLHLRAPSAAFVPGQKSGPFAWRSARGWAEGFYISAVKRAAQALEARLLVDELFDGDPDALIAVTGDCNAELREAATRILRADTEDTGNGALSGRALVAVERALPEDRRFTVLHAGRPIMLDHLLASRALMSWCRGCEVHNEALGDELVAYANVDASPESYHAPLIGVFEVPA